MKLCGLLQNVQYSISITRVENRVFPNECEVSGTSCDASEAIARVRKYST